MAYKTSDKCKGCDECAQICPVRAVSGEMKELHEIDPNRCIDCGACSKVCEYQSIHDNEGKLCKFVPKEQWKKPVVDANLCNGCGLCVEDCPAYCMDIVDGVSVLVDAEVCHGCGVCERRCPVQAISLK